MTLVSSKMFKGERLPRLKVACGFCIIYFSEVFSKTNTSITEDFGMALFELDVGGSKYR